MGYLMLSEAGGGGFIEGMELSLFVWDGGKNANKMEDCFTPPLEQVLHRRYLPISLGVRAGCQLRGSDGPWGNVFLLTTPVTFWKTFNTLGCVV